MYPYQWCSVISFMLFSSVKKIASQFSFSAGFLRVLQRNRANCRYSIYMIYYKTLAHQIVKAGKSWYLQVSQQAGNPGQPVVQFQFDRFKSGKRLFLFLRRGGKKTCSSSKAGRQKEFLLSRGRISFLLYSSLQLMDKAFSDQRQQFVLLHLLI